MHSPVDIRPGVYSKHCSRRRYVITLVGRTVKDLNPGMVHGAVAGIDDIAVFDQVLRLVQISRHVEDRDPALKTLTVRHQRYDHLRIGDARNRHHADRAVLQEGLNSRTFSRTFIHTDKGRRRHLAHGSVKAAFQIQDAARIACSEHFLHRIADLSGLANGHFYQFAARQPGTDIVRGGLIEA